MAVLTRLCVFCGSSLGSRGEFRAAAETFGSLLAEEGIELVYGGGSVGLMGLLADAMQAAGGRVIGVITEALVSAEVAHKNLEDLRIVRSMHERKQLMSDLADGFVALPGGFGTFEELLETITWAQLGIHSKPIGVLNVAGYYDPLLELIQRAIADGFIPKANSSLLEVDDNQRALLQKLRSHEPLPPVRKWLDPTEV